MEHAQRGVVYHLVQTCAKERVGLVVGAATACHLALLATKMSVPAMLTWLPTVANASAHKITPMKLRFHWYLYLLNLQVYIIIYIVNCYLCHLFFYNKKWQEASILCIQLFTYCLLSKKLFTYCNPYHLYQWEFVVGYFYLIYLIYYLRYTFQNCIPKITIFS